MKPTVKLLLDIVMGAVIPILILNNLTRPLGAPVAYVVAALAPVAWIAVDLLLITRRLNVITGYIGLSAIISGALAFWFVDGLLYAIKDSMAFVVSIVVFGGSMLLARPLLRHFFAQVVNPDTPARQAALDDLFRQPTVHRALMLGTGIIVLQSLVLAAINTALNLQTVVAPFGVEEFNQQVAQVNAITRVLFPVPSIVAFGLALWLAYRAVFRVLPSEEGASQFESDFWHLVTLRDTKREQAGGG